jgi:cytidylate kinase
MKIAPRSIEHLIEDQAHKWQVLRTEKKHLPSEPVITISRLTGSRGGQIAQKLAEDLEYDLFGRELIQKVAESAHLSAAVVGTLDEKGKSTLDEWLLSGVSRHYLWSDEYLRHLATVVGTAAKHGRAVIFGRGGSFLVPPRESVRVLIVAPEAVRILRVAEEQNISPEEAKDRLKLEDAERRAYIKKYFHADFIDPNHYDLVVNTEFMSIEAAVDLIKAAWKARKTA